MRDGIQSSREDRAKGLLEISAKYDFNKYYKRTWDSLKKRHKKHFFKLVDIMDKRCEEIEKRN